MLLDSKSLYTATNLNCSCLIENAYYGSKFTKLVCVHCGSCSLVEPIISSSKKGNISKSVERVTTNESVKGCYSISSPGTSINEVVQFNVCQTDNEVVVINERKRQSIIAWNTVPKKKGNASHCDVCGKEDPLTKGRKGKKVDWVDCDHCSKWAHLDCTEICAKTTGWAKHINNYIKCCKYFQSGVYMTYLVYFELTVKNFV